MRDAETLGEDGFGDDVRPVTAHWEADDERAAFAALDRGPQPAPVGTPGPDLTSPPAPSDGLLAGPASLRAELERERAARITAERSAQRLAAAVAKEHRLREQAEREAHEAVQALELARTHRYLTGAQGIRGGRASQLMRRLRRALRA